MGISDILIVYLLSLSLIPLTVSAYALSHIIMVKDFEPEIQLGCRLMRRCMKAIPVYFSGVTACTLLYLWLTL
jgi:hypothetical protein